MKRQEGRPYGIGRECSRLTVAEAAYIAGLIDGEGTIGICYRKPADIHKVRFTLMVGVNMTARAPLDWLARATGLSTVTGPHARPFRERPIYRWQCGSTGAATLVEQIRPYLVLKCGQADLLMRMHGEVRAEPARMRDTAWLFEMKASFHVLNARGAHRAA